MVGGDPGASRVRASPPSRCRVPMAALVPLLPEPAHPPIHKTPPSYGKCSFLGQESQGQCAWLASKMILINTAGARRGRCLAIPSLCRRGNGGPGGHVTGQGLPREQMAGRRDPRLLSTPPPPSLTLCKSRGTRHSPASVGPHTTGCGRKGLAWLISEPRGEPRGRDPVSPPPVPSAPTHLRSSRFPRG